MAPKFLSYVSGIPSISVSILLKNSDDVAAEAFKDINTRNILSFHSKIIPKMSCCTKA